MSSLSQFFGSGNQNLEFLRIYAAGSSSRTIGGGGGIGNRAPVYSGGIYIGNVPIPKSGLTITYSYFSGTEDTSAGTGATTLKIGDTPQFVIPGSRGAIVVPGQNGLLQLRSGISPEPNNIGFVLQDPQPFGIVYGYSIGDDQQPQNNNRNIEVGLNAAVPEVNQSWCVPNGPRGNQATRILTTRGAGTGTGINQAGTQNQSNGGGILIAYSTSIGAPTFSTTTSTQPNYQGQRVIITTTATLDTQVSGTLTIPAY